MVAAACNFGGEKCLDDDLESTGKSQLIDGKTYDLVIEQNTTQEGATERLAAVNSRLRCLNLF